MKLFRSATVLCILLWMPHHCNSIIVQQSPRVLNKRPGDSAELYCHHDDSNYPNMYWYQQPEGRGGLKLMTYSFSTGDATDEEEFKGRLNTIRDGAQKGWVTIKNLKASDTGLYFCAARDGNYEAYFGGGTKLTVLDKDPKEPKVSIFHPSVDEIRQKKKATLVCVAYDFYPDSVSITWKMTVNDVEEEGDFKTDDYPAKNDNLYSMSSRLRVHSSSYFNPKSRFQCIVKFTLSDDKVITTTQEIPGREECGITPESYHKGTSAGKFTYLLLLSKSAFYGFIMLTVILWQAKVSSAKNFS